MKKHITLILIPLIFSYSAPKQKKVERIIEDGVEVIVNHSDLSFAINFKNKL